MNEWIWNSSFLLQGEKSKKDWIGQVVCSRLIIIAKLRLFKVQIVNGMVKLTSTEIIILMLKLISLFRYRKYGDKLFLC